MTTTELKIEGMTCGHCVRAVEEALREVEGVTAVRVEIGHATVEGEGVDRDELVHAVEEEDYRVVG